MYLESIKSFPKTETRLHTEKGSAHHIKTDVFKEQMWYVYEGDAAIGSGLIALSPSRVREIIKMNQEGKKPKELLEFKHEVVIKEPDYDNVVGQDSLNRFDQAFKSKNKKKKKKPGNRPPGAEQSQTQSQPIRDNAPRPPQAQTSEAGEIRPGGNNKRRNRPNRKKGGPNNGGNDQQA
jgi:hypothetical protein